MAEKKGSSKNAPFCIEPASGEEAEYIRLCKEDTEVVKLLLNSIYRSVEGVNKIAPLIHHVFKKYIPAGSNAEEWGLNQLQVTGKPAKGKEKKLATLDIVMGMKTFTAKYNFEGGHEVEIKISLQQS